MTMMKERWYLADRAEPAQELEVYVNHLTLRPEADAFKRIYAYRVYSGQVMHHGAYFTTSRVLKSRSAALELMLVESRAEHDKRKLELEALEGEIAHLQAELKGVAR